MAQGKVNYQKKNYIEILKLFYIRIDGQIKLFLLSLFMLCTMYTVGKIWKCDIQNVKIHQCTDIHFVMKPSSLSEMNVRIVIQTSGFMLFSFCWTSGPSWGRGGPPGGAAAAELNGLQRQRGKPSSPHQHWRRLVLCHKSAQSMTELSIINRCITKKQTWVKAIFIHTKHERMSVWWEIAYTGIFLLVLVYCNQATV